jgi:hypothetical protein
VPIDIGAEPNGLLSRDLDGDGDQDLLTSNGFPALLTIFYQISPGVFSSGVPLEGSQGSGGLTARDYDGDGALDLALHGNAGLMLYLQGEPMSFTPSFLVPIAFTFTSADLDRNGTLDFVTTASSFGSYVVHQTSPGVFAPPVLVSPQGGERVLEASDLDGDGRVDFVNDLFAVGLELRFQSGPGDFTALQELTRPGLLREASDLAVGDLDGNGVLDLVSSYVGSDNLGLFRQEVPGAFAPALVVGGPAELVDPTEVVLADLNQDGALDLASANEGSDDVTLFFQEADLKFASPLALGGGGASQGPRELLAADMDRDGDLDLAWADSSALTVAFQ